MDKLPMGNSFKDMTKTTIVARDEKTSQMPAMAEVGGGPMDRFLRAYDPSQVIFKEGDPGDSMYVVEDGVVGLYKEGTQGPLKLASLGKGEFFGEMALVDRSPRSASAVAGAEGARVIAVDSAHFIYLVSQQPAFALVVLHVMASRLRSKNEDDGK